MMETEKAEEGKWQRWAVAPSREAGRRTCGRETCGGCGQAGRHFSGKPHP